MQAASECASITLSLRHCEKAISIITESYESTAKAVRARMAELSKLVRDYGGDHSVQVNTTFFILGIYKPLMPVAVEQEELYTVYFSGITTPATLQFFQTVLNDAGLAKLYRSTETTASIVETIVSPCNHCCAAVWIIMSPLSQLFAGGASLVPCPGACAYGALYAARVCWRG